jgi:hypothetical protein
MAFSFTFIKRRSSSVTLTTRASFVVVGTVAQRTVAFTARK